MQSLTQQINELERYIPQASQTAPQVSQATVGWQIAHTLKVITTIVEGLAQSAPQDYQPKMSVIKTAIMTTGFMPRGKARAPKIVLPTEEELQTQDLEKQLAKAHEALERLQTLPPTVHFNHPMFGSLQKKAAAKFLSIHTEHHLKIIRDMLQIS